MKRSLPMIFCAVMLSGCVDSEFGDYHASPALKEEQLNISANQVIVEKQMREFAFADRSASLDDISKANIVSLSRHNIAEVWIYGPQKDALADSRRLTITRLLRSRGIASTDIFNEVAPELSANVYRIEAATTDVLPPDCPNWRSSSKTNYSNQVPSNVGCATVTNIGRMAADPRDLLRGQGNAYPDATLSTKAIQDYRSGKNYYPSGTGGSALSTTGGAAAATGAQ